MDNQVPDTVEYISEANQAEAFSGPSFFCNRCYVTPMPLGVRLTFLETNTAAQKDEFRTSVFLQLTDAIAFRDVLTEMLKNVNVQMLNKVGAERDGTE